VDQQPSIYCTSSPTVTNRLLEAAALRFFSFRGDPVARILTPGARPDPYPRYAELRRRGLVRSPLGLWATARHDVATSVLRDRRFSSSPVHQPGYTQPTYPEGDPRNELIPDSLLTMDPPDHTRLRRLVSKAFSPQAITELEPWTADRTDGLLAYVNASSDFDLIDALAFPLPIAVICHLLGVPEEDHASFRVWGHDLVATLEPHSSAALRRAQASELALTRYLRDLVQKRRVDPDNSLLSALVEAEEEGDRLNSDELVSTAMLLLVAGFETTVNLIGNGTVALLGQPECWERLHDEPNLVSSAVEELLRFDSPVQMTSRTATDDVEIEGEQLSKGTTVLVAIGGANHDPNVFERPEELRIDRAEAPRHLSFSFGIHSCLGAALARLEARIVFLALTDRFPRLRLTKTPARRPLLVLRGFESVRVRPG
jgi:cytochrome P450